MQFLLNTHSTACLKTSLRTSDYTSNPLRQANNSDVSLDGFRFQRAGGRYGQYDTFGDTHSSVSEESDSDNGERGDSEEEIRKYTQKVGLLFSMFSNIIDLKLYRVDLVVQESHLIH